MKFKQRFEIWMIVAACGALAWLPPTATQAQETDVDQQICRGNLQFLGAALGLYIQENARQLPKKPSQLFTAGYVLDLGVFVCPGSGHQVANASQIDENTDFDMVTKLPEDRPARLIWQKSGDKKGPRLAFYSDGSIREMKDSGGPSLLAAGGASPSNEGTTSGGAKPVSPDPTEKSGELAEAEPNNTREKASPVVTEQTIRGTIAPVRDIDWYKVEVGHQGALDVKIGSVAKNLDIYLRVFDKDGRQVQGWAGPKGVGQPTEKVVDLATRGVYYLEISDGNHNASSEQAYDLKTAFKATADVAEPNNTRKQASSIVIGEPVKANILPVHDIDWYKVQVDHQGALDVKIGKVAENLDIYLRVFDEDGRQVQRWAGPKGAGQPTEKVVDLPTKGVYYLEVSDGNNNARSEEPYEMILGFTQTADPAEPNNKRATASVIAVDKVFKANILPRGDIDWYWLAVGHQGALKIVTTSVPPNLDIYFRVFDEEGIQVHSWIGPKGLGQPTKKVVDLPTRGSYFLEVSDGNNNARASEPYALQLGFNATGDDGEPNNTREMALPITLGEAIKANILPIGDMDWYRVDVGAEGILKVMIDNVAENLDVYFRVYDETGKQVHSWVGPKGVGQPTEKEIKLPGKGKYYLELSDGNNNARSSEPYSLRTSFSPTRGS